MCLGLGRWLKPGGRLVTLMCNPQLYFYKPSPEYRKYGFTMKLADKVSEGAPILWTSFVEGGSINIENYYLPLEATESAFQQAGFRDFKVHQLELGPNPDGTDDCDFWEDFLKWPIAVLVDCIKT